MSCIGERVICVLGMHRSGTSCLAGSMEEAGVCLGDVQRNNPYNLKGNCEHVKIMNLHDDLFGSNGGSWDDPPARMIWSERHRNLRDEIIKEYADIPLWGFKDPRVLFALDGWEEVLPVISFVGTFRHPVAVARSLERRNKFGLEKGFKIWLSYNRRLLECHQKSAFPVISFDLDQDTYKQKLSELLTLLGLSLSPEKFVFFDADLRHGKEEAYELPSEVRDCYDKLQKIAI